LKEEDVLNPEQKKVLENTEGVKMVVSGPGTGKTTTVTYFLSRIIKREKALPEEILAVTFTNKAAEEMKKRVEEMTGERPHVSTIHYFAARILREFPARGYSSDFYIVDDKEQFRLIARMSRELKLDKHPNEVMEKLTLARNLRDRNILLREGLEGFYHQYLAYLREQRSIDFDGLLTWCLDTLEKKPAALRSCQARFKYLLIDEFQDISPLQYVIIRLLAQGWGNLICVGDFDQGIYSFRGADINIMLNLKKDFPRLTTYYLERNYRSTQKIVRAANHLIRHNTRREDKPHWTERKEGEEIKIKSFQDARKEADFISSFIKSEVQRGKSYSDFGVIYRVNTLSQILESTFSGESIPYLVMGGPGYFQRAEVQDVLSFFKLAADHRDANAFNRAALVLARMQGSSFRSLKANGDLMEAARKAKESYIRQLPGIVQDLSSRSSLLEIYRLVLHYTGYLNFLKKDKSSAGEKKVDHVEYLEEVISGFSQKSNCLGDFLDFVEKTGAASPYHDSVKLLTIHSAKGLEFNTVFLAGATENMLPHYRNQSPEEVEEERRLFYVAVTRAQNRLFITCPKVKKQGKGSRQLSSPFIKELGLESDRNPSKDETSIRRGGMVYHQQFGKGEVLEVENNHRGEKEIKVTFPGSGVKKLNLEYAPVETDQ